jgi:hypothetical protein
MTKFDKSTSSLNGPEWSTIRPLAREIGISPNTLRKVLNEHGVKGRKVTDKLTLLHRHTVHQLFTRLPEKPLLGSGDAPTHLKRRCETVDT